MIRAENLSKKFRNHEALRGLTFAVPEGSAFALIGANGAGKTTTLKILMNILAPSSGSATVMGVDSRRLSPREFRRIGYVSQSQELPGRLTVRQFLSYLRPFYPDWDAALEASTVNLLRLPPDRKIGELSYGMKMKMSLACALPFRPALLILDEPFSGLDPLVRDEFMESLIQQAGEMTVLISSHALGGDRRTKVLGWCGTRLDDAGGEIEFGCINAGSPPSCASLTLEYTPTHAQNPKDRYCNPDFAPFRRRFDADALSRFTERLPFGDPNGIDLYPVKSSMLADSRVDIRVYRPEDSFTRQLVIPSIHLRDWARE